MKLITAEVYYVGSVGTTITESNDRMKHFQGRNDIIPFSPMAANLALITFLAFN